MNVEYSSNYRELFYICVHGDTMQYFYYVNT